MVCREGNFKINNFQKQICQPRSSITAPVWNSFSRQVSHFVTIGSSHTVVTSEQAPWILLLESGFLVIGRPFR